MFVNDAKEYIKKVFKGDNDLAVMLWGPPGIGKTSICESAAKELGMGYLCLQVSVYNPIDMAGLPCPDKEEGVAQYLPPSFLLPALKATEPMVLVFDEIASAPPAVQVATQRVILERKFGEFELPPHVKIAATGNRASDRANTFNMPAPLANRFLHITDLEPSVEDWKKWALNNGINPMVISYLNFDNTALYNFPSNPEIKAFPTPRSWEFVSRLMEDFSIDDDDFYLACSTAIGKPAAVNFVAFAETHNSLPDIEDILNGKTTPEVSKDRVDLLHAITGALVAGLRRDPSPKRATNFLGYIDKYLPAEFTWLAARDAFSAGLGMQLQKAEQWEEFAKENVQWIL